MRGNKLGGQRRQDEVDFYLNHKISDDHKNNHQRSTSPYGLFAEEVGHCMLPYIKGSNLGTGLRKLAGSFVTMYRT